MAVDLALINFIFHNLFKFHLTSLVVFNCWNLEILYTFSKTATYNNVYTLYINLDNRSLRNDFDIRVLQLNRPILGIFLDMNCENSEYIVNMTSYQLLFTDHLHWLLYDNNANLSYFKELFEKVNLFANADVTFIVPNKERTNIQNTSYIIYDVYNNGRSLGGKLNITLDHEVVCNNTKCQLSQYYSKLHLRSKYGNRNTLKDVTLRIAAVANKFPITAPEKEIQKFLISENKPYVDSIARFGYHRLLILQDVLKFQMNLTYHDRWSKTDAVGGSVGDLGTERVELTSTPFLPTAARFENLTAITEAADFHMICMFRTPRNAGIQGDVFLAPFSTTVWCVFGIILFISGIFLWAIFYLENHRLKKCLNYVPCLLTACLISFGFACSQGSFLLPRSTGGRMAFFSLLLISFFMYNYYTSIIVSTLLGSPIKSHIKTMGQLADSNLEVAMEPLPYTASYLNTSKLPDVRRFVARKVEPQKNNPKLWLSVEEGVKLMRDNPGFVYVFTAATGYELVEKFFKPHEICDTNEVLFRPEKYLYSHTHKNSTYKELIRLTEVRLLETGVYLKLRRYFMRRRLNCFATNFVIDVGLEYTAPLFFLLLTSYLLVLFIFIVEIYYKKYMVKRSSKE